MPPILQYSLQKNDALIKTRALLYESSQFSDFVQLLHNTAILHKIFRFLILITYRFDNYFHLKTL